ncbi:MAG: c-type cytochrome [Gallionella sp.]
MSHQVRTTHFLSMLCTLTLMFFATTSLAEVDADAATSLAKKNNCFKCHAVDKTKVGPSFKQVATNLKDDPDAEAKLVTHLTTGPIVKLQGGIEMNHEIIDTQDQAEIKNLVHWILSR